MKSYISTRRSVPYRCGACGHEHAGPIDDTGTAGCPDCPCTAFRLHEDLLAARAAAQAAEDAAYPNGTILDAHVADGLHQVLRTVENDWQQLFGWDAPPGLGVLRIGAAEHPHLDGGGQPMVLMPVRAFQLRLPARFWHVTGGGDPLAATECLAELAEQHPAAFEQFCTDHGLPPEARPCGWWAVVEAYERRDEQPGSANTDPSLAVDELRQLVCVDADERVYEITRRRGDNSVIRAMRPLQLYRQDLADDIAEVGGLPADVRSAPSGLPPMLDALLRIMRVTRTETVLRGLPGDGPRP